MGLQPYEGTSQGIDYSRGILEILNSQLTRLKDRRAIGSGQEDGVSSLSADMLLSGQTQAPMVEAWRWRALIR